MNYCRWQERATFVDSGGQVLQGEQGDLHEGRPGCVDA